MLVLAFAAVAFTILAGFSVYSYVTAQKRKLELVLLRSLGMPTASLVGLIFFEQLAVVAIGLTLGSLIGMKLTTVIIPFLGLTEVGMKVLPPMQVAVNWPAIVALYAVIGLAFLVATVGVVLFVCRLEIQRVLRLGEM